MLRRRPLMRTSEAFVPSDEDLRVNGELLRLNCPSCSNPHHPTAAILGADLFNVLCLKCRSPLFLLSELYDWGMI